MGLVKFNNTTLSIEQVPDGHIIIAEAEFTRIRDAGNAYAVLKSKIPLGVDENQLGVMTEKGMRYDTTAQQLAAANTKVGELTTQVNQFSNIPKDFKPEKWEQFKAAEQAQIRNTQRAEIQKKAVSQIQDKYKGISVPEIDDRFFSKEELDKFDYTATDAVEKYVQIMDKAHTEQENFMMKQLGGGALVTQSAPVGVAPAVPSPTPVAVSGQNSPRDIVTEAGATLQKF